MATGYKTCKICGEKYPYCKTLRQTPGVFRWQDVACSEEHGRMYLQEVLEARGELEEPVESKPKAKPAKKVEPMKKAPVEEDAVLDVDDDYGDDEYDGYFGDDSEDDEDEDTEIVMD